MRNVVLPVAASLSLMLGCANKDRAVQTEAPNDDRGPGIDEIHYVSSDHDDAPAKGNVLDEDDAPAEIAGDFAVRSPARALELAEAAVSNELDPKLTWKASPALPTQWPSHDQKVLYLFYPMANNPASLSHYQLFSPAYEVEVSLVDGSTEIRSTGKRRRLGVIEERRPNLSERQELELAENTLVRLLLAGEASQGDNNFWGYLKYFHENPKFASDIKARSPRFVKWLYTKKR
jgi:hypothetical protein